MVAASLGFDLSNVSFFLGRETPVPTVHPPLALWREKLFAFMTRNAVSAADYFQIPPKRVVELDPGRIVTVIGSVLV